METVTSTVPLVGSRQKEALNYEGYGKKTKTIESRASGSGTQIIKAYAVAAFLRNTILPAVSDLCGSVFFPPSRADLRTNYTLRGLLRHYIIPWKETHTAGGCVQRSARLECGSGMRELDNALSA